MSAAPILAAFRQSLGEAWAGGAGALLPLGFLGGAAVLVPPVSYTHLTLPTNREV